MVSFQLRSIARWSWKKFGNCRGFSAAAHRAFDAGFDGVEPHGGANGYLVDQFMQALAQQAHDAGPVGNRAVPARIRLDFNSSADLVGVSASRLGEWGDIEPAT